MTLLLARSRRGFAALAIPPGDDPFKWAAGLAEVICDTRDVTWICTPGESVKEAKWPEEQA